MPQLQHNMWVVAARTAALSIITGGGKWVEIKTHADPLYQHLIVTAERKFWHCVENGEPPNLFGVEPPKPRIEAVRIVDMTSSNAWAEFAAIFSRTRSAYLEHEQAKAELKTDARGCSAGDWPWPSSKAIEVGSDRFDRLEQTAAMQRSSPSIGTLASALAKAQGELVNPEKSHVATIRGEGRRGGSRPSAMRPCRAGSTCAQDLGRHEIATVQTTSIDQIEGITSHHSARARLGGMDRLGLASLRRQRNRNSASNGSGADLCPTLCPVHARGHCRRGRSRCP